MASNFRGVFAQVHHREIFGHSREGVETLFYWLRGCVWSAQIVAKAAIDGVHWEAGLCGGHRHKIIFGETKVG